MPLIGHADPIDISISTANTTDDTAATHTHKVVASSNPGAAEQLLQSNADGGLTLQELTVMVEANLAKLTASQVGSHLIPELTDTHDLGSSTKLWRKGWISELESVLFAQNSASIIGGWFVIPKASGTLSADVDDVQTTIDFGQTMTQNDFVLLRTSGAVEYIQVGTLDSGTTYNVTRDVDGSGANSWPSGQVYMVLGNVGNGRIELNAQDTPRISILEQGATYNAQTELVRLGDLDGNWGYSSPTDGLALGEYAANKSNLTWDPTNGLRLRTYNDTVVQLDNAGNASIEGVLNLGNDGGIYQGSGSFASPDTGLKLSNEAGVGTIAGFTNGDKQWWGDTDGAFYFNNGRIRLSGSGMEFIGGGGEDGKLAMGGVFIDNLIGESIELTNIADPLDANPASILLKAEAGPQGFHSGQAEIVIEAGHSNSSINPSHIATSKIDLNLEGNTYLRAIKQWSGNGPNKVETFADLYVNGAVRYTGTLRPIRNGTHYTAYSYVPSIKSSTNWNGDAKVANTIHTLTMSEFGLPAGVKAVNVVWICSQASNGWVRVGGNSGYPEEINYELNAGWRRHNGITAVINDRFYFQSNSTINQIWLSVTGYWI